MANVPESATFDAGIYQIEITDAVIGGVNGISNLQAKGLANRTTWLKAQVDALNLLKGTGIPIFSAANSYAGGQQVIYQKNIWQSNTSITPGAFNSANWTRQLGVAAESALADAVPLVNGTAAVGTSTDVAREDHVHPTDTSRAPLASPNFTGSPTAPTPVQFGNGSGLATTEFVQRALGGFGRTFGYGTSGQTIPAAQVNSHFNLYGSCNTLTLPLTSSVPAGSVIYIGSSSLTCIISRQGTDTIFLNSANPSSTSITINDGESVLFVAVGSVWMASGVATLNYATSFGASLASNGYQKLPSGLIKQWGVGTFPSSGAQSSAVTVTLPLAWPSGVGGLRSATANARSAANSTVGGIPVTGVDSGTATTITFLADTLGYTTFNKTTQFYWEAEGV